MRHVVLLLPAHWAAALGGAEYQVRLLAEHLVAAGNCRLTWVCRRVNPDYRPEGYEIRQIAPHEGFRTRGFFLDHFQLGGLLKTLRPDVIYQRVGCAYTGIAAQYARRTGCCMIWHVASDSDVTPVRQWGLRDTLLPFKRVEKAALEYGVRHAPQIVVQTYQQSALLQTHYQREATALVRNFHPLPQEPIDKKGPVTVVWIGNLKPVKNPLAYVELAYAMRHHSDIRFLMVGDPRGDIACAQEIAERARDLPGFRFLGKLTQEEVNQLLAEAHLLVNTSHWEGFSNTFIQAWMREVPVLSLNADPDGLLMQEGLGYCARGDGGALAKNLSKLLTDHALRADMGRRARVHAERHHTECNMQALVDLIEA